MREPGSDGNLNVMFFKKFQIICLMTIVHDFTWNLLENMTNRLPHIPDFAWISHALPRNNCSILNEPTLTYTHKTKGAFKGAMGAI